MQENYKKYFTIDEINAIIEMKKDGYSEIALNSENGITPPDFTSYKPENILKITAEFCKHNGADFFSDPRLENIDILINVIVYDGYWFSDERYYFSDFIMRTNNNFPKTKKSAFVKLG